jgi:hypothetical protein
MRKSQRASGAGREIEKGGGYRGVERVSCGQSVANLISLGLVW